MWKDIKGWESYYEISDLGEVRNKKTNKLVCIDYSNRSGYARVTLYYKDKPKKFLLHRLVMSTFVGDSDLEVNHIDSDKRNNSLTNLEYVTRVENARHCMRFGSKHNNYKPFIVEWLNGEVDMFETKSELANEVKVTIACVKMWLRGNTKGYTKYNIKDIHYVESNKCQTTNCSAKANVVWL